MIHRIHWDQAIPAPIEKVWEYFCDPSNLNAITPPDMNFEILSGGNVRMYEGQLIEYRVEFVRGIRSRWLTEISHVRECEYFVDEQRIGPYRFWYHEHGFEAAPSGSGTRMTDSVTYAVSAGFLGDILNSVWISGRLDQIFTFRRKTIIERFGEAK
jgi:ligand-binding SRPBCC domain-containing protein